MKYVVLLGDGMSDLPVASLGGRTPLEAANIPNMDYLAMNGEMGRVYTVPPNMPPGSDVANMSVMGYDVQKIYSGRASLEALAQGHKMQPDELALRVNLVTISGEERFEDRVMLDYCAGDISSSEAAELMKAINANFKDNQVIIQNIGENDSIRLDFYPGVSYRNLLITNAQIHDQNLTPPHDITNKRIGDFLPKDSLLKGLMLKSAEILAEHPVNLARIASGKRPANCIWLWGLGTAPKLQNFEELTGCTGAVITAVDLLRGIAVAAGMKIVNVEGATGYIDTNFEGKANAAIDTLKSGMDLVYIHIEAPDECGHRMEVENKVRSVELIDEKVLGPLLTFLRGCGDDYKILLTPDHATPLALGTHTSEAVPYVIYSSSEPIKSGAPYCEKNAKVLFSHPAWMLMQYFVHGSTDNS